MKSEKGSEIERKPSWHLGPSTIKGEGLLCLFFHGKVLLHPEIILKYSLPPLDISVVPDICFRWSQHLCGSVLRMFHIFWTWEILSLTFFKMYKRSKLVSVYHDLTSHVAVKMQPTLLAYDNKKYLFYQL